MSYQRILPERVKAAVNSYRASPAFLCMGQSGDGLVMRFVFCGPKGLCGRRLARSQGGANFMATHPVARHGPAASHLATQWPNCWDNAMPSLPGSSGYVSFHGGPVGLAQSAFSAAVPYPMRCHWSLAIGCGVLLLWEDAWAHGPNLITLRQ